MNQANRVESVRRHVKSYEERADAWKVDHDVATHCYEVEENIAYGIFVFERISRFDEDLHDGFFKEAIAFSAEAVNDVEQLYRQWSVVGENCIKAIEDLERRGYRVEGAEAFRQRIQEAKGAATPDNQFFAGESLAILRDDAIDAHRQGQTEALEA